jgi:hypothetical protein
VAQLCFEISWEESTWFRPIIYTRDTWAIVVCNSSSSTKLLQRNNTPVMRDLISNPSVCVRNSSAPDMLSWQLWRESIRARSLLFSGYSRSAVVIDVEWVYDLLNSDDECTTQSQQTFHSFFRSTSYFCWVSFVSLSDNCVKTTRLKF